MNYSYFSIKQLIFCIIILILTNISLVVMAIYDDLSRFEIITVIFIAVVGTILSFFFSFLLVQAIKKQKVRK